MYYLKFSDFYFSRNKQYNSIDSSGEIRSISDELRYLIPRGVQQRGFSFSPLQYLALEQISSDQKLFLGKSDADKRGMGILLGSSTGGFHEYFKQGKRFYKNGLKRVSPLTIPRTIHNTGSAVLAIEYRLQGVSAGYNGDQSVGLVAFLDSLLAIDHKEQSLMFFGAGEQIQNEEAENIDGAFLGLASNQSFEGSSAISIPFSLGRGKPWLTNQDNVNDLLASAQESLGALPENIFINQKIFKGCSSLKPIDLSCYSSMFSDLKSIAPLLGFSNCLSCGNDFVYIVTTQDGFGIILVVKY